ncbi:MULTISPECIES: LrgB family protein [Brucella]|uniref:LrgB protein n=1 Tax=Brucella ceti str. Cudo TaxID=595497 RepID=C0G487_9HYPH|nr:MULTISPECIES: LrgB family protein [Brucella]EEH15552.1 LrgB protein [Brucella ceti str. Cudo]EEX86784.1 LrgB family protein [Brucella ceti B1/94]EEY25548.1 LrgB family protein [Brucella sp. F5/99]EEZ07968.1 LrgB family protein [Brucella ceti M490/95/1]ENT11750.1 TIGR00659 family protein [Brucella sp. F23/97]
MLPGDPLGNPFVATLFWSAATILLYLAAKRVYRRFPLWWLTPLAVTPLLLMALVIGLDENYRVYFSATYWLVALLGPATVAFAIPIYQQRATIRRYWPVLLAGVLVGSSAAMASAWGLAHLLGLNEAISLSLMPRSMSTPFAMTVSGDIGGRPDLTAIFVVLTGIFGAALGEIMLHWLPVRSALARGALFGMGAHGAGVARAHQIGSEEGSIAGLVMVLVGLVNVLAAPLIAHFL